LGGCAALHLALDHPEAIDDLVLVGTFGGVGAFVPAAPRAPVPLGDDLSPEARAAGDATAPSFSATFPIREPQLFWQIATEAAVHHPDVIAAQIDVFMSHDVTPVLGELSMPTTIVCGGDDQTFPLANSELLESSIPAARLRVIDAGHGVHLEAPEALVEAVSEVAADIV